MAAVSPDGKYLAVVRPPRTPCTSARCRWRRRVIRGQAPAERGGGITALSWDRSDDLWVAQNGYVDDAAAAGKAEVPVDVHRDRQRLERGARRRPDRLHRPAPGQPSPGSTSRPSAAASRVPASWARPPRTWPSDRPPSIGPNLTGPVSLAWYNADNLIVLNAAAGGNTLWEVPVDGQPAQELPVTPPRRDLDHRRRRRERPGGRAVRGQPGRLDQPGRPVVPARRARARNPPTLGEPRPSELCPPRPPPLILAVSS